MAEHSGKRVSFTHIKDKKIAIYEGTPVSVSPGISDMTWRLISGGKLWACYRSLSGKELYGAAIAKFTEEVSFTVNWRDDIPLGSRIVFRGKVYQVNRVDDFEGYRKYIRLFCNVLPHFDLNDYPVP